ncbi:MAG: Rpn family recombination-promoting nuclease/putative transposase [Pseudanabaena sp. M090S1SP1A06QC]|jgi:predicted transposase/invertase (TIGR01784 family)|uniref:Rpn family recombination-promoting nuclease/putative transposase n=1 Tax=Pseudanabaena mucicola TaxID=71190 RepID=UPI00257544C7|nr:Rpn family recombination-promoting nuclease/putative transposase [Pseudanabaena mucicola]MCA6604686.1 Rpn family recombination-promoting nuclease/putative transposase [Pseudanabaena sp. M007S1SP1A06QC]MCA6615447.1 Rpn family recombination-promoting nuclease/putative transposase [Pseudanabaena sp. M090S1SP1A06QC]MCA6625054.1 Rpn family recombination-promoting nuclease/putative transposase [Pseudanabaena sp. M165S2SP1A06QC]MCE2975520.1 Rpn family recombination-promoting nuclease/putative trans
MIDNICKFLAETFPSDFARWLLGEAITLTKIEPSELLAEPIRADSVIFLQSAEIILHIEFQTEPNKNIPFRMADYRLRLYRKFPEREIHQVVIYLSPSQSPLVHETTFNIGKLNHEFNVIRLWEQPTEIFQQYHGLFPFAPLSQTNNPEETLRQVAKQIEQITDNQLRVNVAASTAIISGIALNKEIIQRLLRSEIMKESVIYQEILLEGKAEGKAEGIAEGIAKGKAETASQIALNMMRSNISMELIAQFTGLSLKEVQKLQKVSAQKLKTPKSSKPKRSPKP